MPDYTILVIDYDPRALEGVRPPLERAGYHVTVSTDGLSGIEKFNALKPELTLIEFMLPKKSGVEVCRELRKTEHGEQAQLVIMTSRFRSQKFLHQAKRQYRVDEFLEKPFDEERLLDLVNGLIGRPGVGARARSAPETVAEVETVTSTSSSAGPRAEAGPVQEAPVEQDFESEVTDRLDNLLGSL